MNIFVSCGEPSGDVYAGDLIHSLLAVQPCHIWGMLGQKGAQAGGEAVWNYDALHLMGILEVIPMIPRLFILMNKIVKNIIEESPACVVVIDSPDFHLPLIKKLRNDGYRGKIIYLATPTVWAWRSGRAKILKKICDLCLPLFSFEHNWLVNYGINSAWKVHPLVHGLQNYSPPANLIDRFKGERVIAFMPGSRSYDIRWHLDALIESAARVRTLGLKPVFSIAPGLHGELRKKLIGHIEKHQHEICEDAGRALLSVCDAAVGVSGTISVEALLLSRFMVVVYNGNFITWLAWKMLIRTPYISIPNLLAPRQIYPELLQRKMKPENIVSEIKNYLENGVRRDEINADISSAVAAMGQGDAGAFWAARILELFS